MMPFFQTHKKKKLAAITVGLAGLSLFLYQQNNKLVNTDITIASERLPKKFDGFKIVHLSDLHQKRYGKNQSILVGEVRKQSPDFIAVTGDLIDARTSGLEPGITLIEQLMKVAPVYYVTGNHEGKMEGYSFWLEKVKNMKVHLLQGERVKITREDEYIYLLGIDDPEVTDGYGEGKEVAIAAEKSIRSVVEELEEEPYKILLSHRPELFPIYCKYGLDLTLSGHAHGGQIRLPLVGGIFAPGQGIFPKYTTGEYVKKNTHMVVSRGLGPTIFPTRLFNHPEIVVVTLKPQSTLKKEEADGI